MVEAAHTLYREIHEQGEVIERALARESGPTAALASRESWGPTTTRSCMCRIR